MKALPSPPPLLLARHREAPQMSWRRRALAARLATLMLAVVTTTGCTSRIAPARTPASPQADSRPASSAAAALRTPPSAIRVPHPDFGRAASVAAAFFTAWASVDTTRSGLYTDLACCARLVTSALERQLAASHIAPMGWRALHAQRLVSVVYVQAVTHPAGAPPPQPRRVYLRVFALRVTTASGGQAVTSDGITVLLVRQHRRWLVARLLFY